MSSSEEPSVVSGVAKEAQGAVYQAVGDYVSADPSWKEQGEQLSSEGEQELAKRREQEQGEANADKWRGKLQSAYGAATGDKQALNRGNAKMESSEWKEAAAKGEMPVLDSDRLEGKLESAKGMLTGDTDQQAQGNMQAERAEWSAWAQEKLTGQERSETNNE